MGVMRLDYDSATRRGLHTLMMLYNMPYPYRARVSSGGRGLHIERDCTNCTNECYDCMFYVLYDDQKRLKMNRERKMQGMSHNLLFDVKDGRYVGAWVDVCNGEDVEKVLREFSYYWR
ncbi:MAG: hypothetical protein KAJ03_10790 [Gammaproteobacteria bacterium]|nr:hypothetical protein [Gammaproteobacteria bacterium]